MQLDRDDLVLLSPDSFYGISNFFEKFLSADVCVPKASKNEVDNSATTNWRLY